VLLGRKARALASKGTHGLDHSDARGGWFNDSVELTALSSEEGAGNVVGVLVGKLGANGSNVFTGRLGRLDLVAVQNVHRALAAHHGNFSGGPRQVDVSSELLRTHDDVSAAVRLARDDRDQRNGCFGICIEQLGATANNAAPLLVGARQITGDVDDGQNRNRERVAETNKTARLFTCFDVERAGHGAGLVGHNSDSATFNAGKADDDVGSKQWLDLEEVLVVDHALDDLVHVIRLIGGVGDDCVQALVGVGRFENDIRVVHRVLGHVVVWQERNQRASVVEGV
jgi:hypothetical protein